MKARLWLVPSMALVAIQVVGAHARQITHIPNGYSLDDHGCLHREFAAYVAGAKKLGCGYRLVTSQPPTVPVPPPTVHRAPAPAPQPGPAPQAPSASQPPVVVVVSPTFTISPTATAGGTAGSAGSGGSSGAGGGGGLGDTLSKAAPILLPLILGAAQVQPAPASFPVEVGTRLPSDVTARSLPQSVVSMYPDLRRYKYVRSNNQVLFVDPNTNEVVAKIGS